MVQLTDSPHRTSRFPWEHHMQINLAVVSGLMSPEPIHRPLASGDLVVHFDHSTCV